MEKIKELIKKMNEAGIPLPILQDPIQKQPSITYTFFFISGILWTVALVGKWNNALNINLNECQEFFSNAAYIYLGRSLIKNAFKTTDSKKEEQ
jgi:hypothetical protein